MHFALTWNAQGPAGRGPHLIFAYDGWNLLAEFMVVGDRHPQLSRSRRLDMHIDNVYRAKESVTRILRERLALIRALEE